MTVLVNTSVLNQGSVIRVMMAANGLSMREFISKMEVSKVSAYNWVNNKASPRVENFVKMAEVFGLTDTQLGALVKVCGK